jgi:nitroimidazol reductase NimA-like FMN-containing flavoprotein (pyridoxamine 5'-phosphate oxidase superfamily)
MLDIQFKEYIVKMLANNRFAVLATESQGQPHASFIAITATENLLQLFFATYRNTKKYSNLMQNENVSILIENRDTHEIEQKISILTAFGKAKELDVENYDAVLNAHLVIHPEQNDFLKSTDCTLFVVNVDAYQMVLSIDDVKWWKPKT